MLMCLGFAAHASGQSLADAARKAEEQRKETNGPLTTMKQSPAPALREVLLNRTVVQTYVNARTAMARLWHRDRALYDRIRGGGVVVQRLRDFSSVLASEPAVVELLKFYNLTPESIVDVEITLRRALARTQGGYGRLSSVEEENSGYVGKDLGYIQVVIQGYYREEAGMHVWPEWLPY
jgi:hypothetical protein